MAIPATRTQLIEYCLRQLGAPVIEINVDEAQLEDRVDESLQFYQEYHSDAVTRTFVKHVLTQDDIDNREITLPDSVLSIIRVLSFSDSDASGMFSAKYQMYLNDISGPGQMDLVGYELLRQHMSLLDNIIAGSSIQIDYARHKNTLTIQGDVEGYLNVGQYVVIECYQTVDPTAYPEVYNDLALKRYLTALIKKNWGANLIKFEGMQLPGGVTIQGRPIYDEAVNEIKEMEETWMSKYQQPVDFFIG